MVTRTPISSEWSHKNQMCNYLLDTTKNLLSLGSFLLAFVEPSVKQKLTYKTYKVSVQAHLSGYTIPKNKKPTLLINKPSLIPPFSVNQPQ